MTSAVLALLGASQREKNADNTANRMDINRWPRSVRRTSMATRLVDIYPDDVPHLVNRDERAIDKYARLVERAMQGRRAFVRLYSKSDHREECPAIHSDGRKAVLGIVSADHCVSDMTITHIAGIGTGFAVRDIVPARHELRCFARGGQMIAITRHGHEKHADAAWWQTQDPDALIARATAFYYRHLFAEYPKVVFDLCLDEGEHGFADERDLLIDLNQYDRADTGLFDSYHDLEASGGIRL